MRKKLPESAPAAVRPAMVKRSVTIERAVDEAAHALVGDRGFSELVNDAIKRVVQRRLLEQDVSEYERKHGPIPAKDRAYAKLAVEKYLARKK